MTRDLAARYGGWALVTGASSGIGAAYVEALAERRFPVVLVARRADKMQELAAAVRSRHGVETLVVAADLAEPAAVGAIADAVGDREIGFLVNNAGFGYSGRFADRDADDDVRMVQVNCTAVVAMTHRFLPAMLARRRGAVVIVASIAGYQPTPWFAVYGATKAFDLMLAESLWSELRGTGVDVIALSPGRTRTEFSIRAHFDRPPDGADPRSVVEASLGRLGRAPSVVPGVGNKFTAFLHRLVPRAFAAETTGRVLAKELLRTTPDALRRK